MRGVVVGDTLRDDAVENLRLLWQLVKWPVVVPLLRGAVFVCAVMSVMLFLERVYMAVVILFVKVLGRKRYTKYKLEAWKDDLELNNSHPMVLVQIPMYNEKEVTEYLLMSMCANKKAPK